MFGYPSENLEKIRSNLVFTELKKAQLAPNEQEAKDHQKNADDIKALIDNQRDIDEYNRQQYLLSLQNTRFTPSVGETILPKPPGITKPSPLVLFKPAPSGKTAPKSKPKPRKEEVTSEEEEEEESRLTKSKPKTKPTLEFGEEKREEKREEVQPTPIIEKTEIKEVEPKGQEIEIKALEIKTGPRVKLDQNQLDSMKNYIKAAINNRPPIDVSPVYDIVYLAVRNTLHVINVDDFDIEDNLRSLYKRSIGSFFYSKMFALGYVTKADNINNASDVRDIFQRKIGESKNAVSYDEVKSLTRAVMYNLYLKLNAGSTNDVIDMLLSVSRIVTRSTKSYSDDYFSAIDTALQPNFPFDSAFQRSNEYLSYITEHLDNISFSSNYMMEYFLEFLFIEEYLANNASVVTQMLLDILKSYTTASNSINELLVNKVNVPKRVIVDFKGNILTLTFILKKSKINSSSIVDAINKLNVSIETFTKQLGSLHDFD
jgi:hypothetical protein